MDNLRIGLIGTCCTGKSTLSKKLSEFLNINLIPEYARLFYKNCAEGKLNDIFTEYTEDGKWNRKSASNQLNLQQLIKSARLIKENDIIQQNQSFITDRTYLDDFVYRLYYCGSLLHKNKCLEDEKLYKNLINKYSHLFLLSLGDIPYKKDDERIEEYGESLLYETSINGIIERWNLKDKVINIPYVNIYDRIMFITLLLDKDVYKIYKLLMSFKSLLEGWNFGDGKKADGNVIYKALCLIMKTYIFSMYNDNIKDLKIKTYIGNNSEIELDISYKNNDFTEISFIITVDKGIEYSVCINKPSPPDTTNFNVIEEKDGLNMEECEEKICLYLGLNNLNELYRIGKLLFSNNSNELNDNDLETMKKYINKKYKKANMGE